MTAPNNIWTLSEPLTFANLLHRRFTRAAKLSVDLTSDRAFASGMLPLSIDAFENEWQARCVATISKDWDVNPPRVVCTESWVPRTIDWHVYSSGKLCWILDQEWRTRLAEAIQEQDRHFALLMAVDWLTKNVQYLLCGCRLGKQMGFKKWPAEWPQYAHGKEGVAQFDRLERQRVHQPC